MEHTFACLHKAPELVQQAFAEAELQHCGGSISPTSLCKHHYHMVYNLVEPTQTHCKTCGTWLRYANAKSCPKPAEIEQYLWENAGFQSTLNDKDKVCYVCYRSHLVILQHSTSISKDSDLRELISGLSDHMLATPVKSVEETLDRAMTMTVIEVGNALLDRNARALLLPIVHEAFDRYANLISPKYEVELTALKRSSNWILSNLTSSLQHHIAYNCKTRKYGTLIYRSGTDLVAALTKSLSHQRNAHSSCKSQE